MSVMSTLLVSFLAASAVQDGGRHGFLQITQQPAFSEQSQADFSILTGSRPGSPRYGVVVRTADGRFTTNSDDCSAVSEILTRYSSLPLGQPYVPGLSVMRLPVLRADAIAYTVSGRLFDEEGGWPQVTVTATSGAVAEWASQSFEVLLTCRPTTQ